MIENFPVFKTSSYPLKPTLSRRTQSIFPSALQLSIILSLGITIICSKKKKGLEDSKLLLRAVGKRAEKF